MKLVINSCYGGFSISDAAEKEYLKRIGKEQFLYKNDRSSGSIDFDNLIRMKDGEDGFCSYTYTKDLGEKTTFKTGEEYYFYSSDIPRDDKILIAVVEEMGEEAFGRCAELSIIEIPDGINYEVTEYDGIESVEEVHRSWS